jgi:hypothetical protein
MVVSTEEGLATRLLNEQAGLFSLLIRLGEQADEQAKSSHTIC